MWEGNVLQRRTGGREGVRKERRRGERTRKEEERRRGKRRRREKEGPAAPQWGLCGTCTQPGIPFPDIVFEHPELGVGYSENQAAERRWRESKSPTRAFHYLGQRSEAAEGGAPPGWGRDRVVPRNRPSWESHLGLRMRVQEMVVEGDLGRGARGGTSDLGRGPQRG